MRDHITGRTASSAESLSLSSFDFLAALFFGFFLDVDVDFLASVAGDCSAAAISHSFQEEVACRCSCSSSCTTISTGQRGLWRPFHCTAVASVQRFANYPSCLRNWCPRVCNLCSQSQVEIVAECTVKDMGLAEFDQSQQSTAAEPCRFGECWRPLCPFRHSGASRAARWAAGGLCWPHTSASTSRAYVPVPQIAAKIPEVVETIPKEHF